MLAGETIERLQPFYEQSELINVVVDTPKGSPYKLKYEEESGVFRVHKALPLGLAFPFNFGFLPSTVGGDGDPVDVLLLSDLVMPVGSVVLGRLVAVLRGNQTEAQKTRRNDRLIAVPVELASRKVMQPAVEFNSAVKLAIVQFFVKYNELQGKTFRSLGYAGAGPAVQIVRRSLHSSS